MGIKHGFTSAMGDGGNAALLQPSNWNADHQVVGNTFAIGSASLFSGTGSPEGVLTAPLGSLYMRTDGPAPLYVKASGTGNTGWSAVTYTLTPGGGPPANLQTAINDAVDGATIYATGGTYSGAITINKPLTIVGGTLNVAAATTAILITSSNVTIDGMAISGAQSHNLVTSERGVDVSGVRTNITVKNCTIGNFGFGGIWVDRCVSGLQLDHNTIYDIFYAGIMALSCTGGNIEYNDIDRIGVGWTTGGNGGGFDTNNSYGIALSAATYPTVMSANLIVRYNDVADVPVWHALDAHGGIDINFNHNTTRRASRPIFITSHSGGSSTRVIVTANTVESPSPISYNLCAVTMYSTVNCSVTDNFLSSGYPDQNQYTPAGDDRVYDYATASTGLTVSGNTLI